MNERNSDTSRKDVKIKNQDKLLTNLRSQAVEMTHKENKLLAEVKYWRGKYDEERTEKEFYHKSALESKKKNKLLKIAI